MKNVFSCVPIKLLPGGGSAEFYVACKLREHASKSSLIHSVMFFTVFLLKKNREYSRDLQRLVCRFLSH